MSINSNSYSSFPYEAKAPSNPVEDKMKYLDSIATAPDAEKVKQLSSDFENINSAFNEILQEISKGNIPPDLQNRLTAFGNNLSSVHGDDEEVNIKIATVVDRARQAADFITSVRGDAEIPKLDRPFGQEPRNEQKDIKKIA